MESDNKRRLWKLLQHIPLRRLMEGKKVTASATGIGIERLDSSQTGMVAGSSQLVVRKAVENMKAYVKKELTIKRTNLIIPSKAMEEDIQQLRSGLEFSRQVYNSILAINLIQGPLIISSLRTIV